MTDLEPQVVDAFERLFPLPAVVEDWDGVLDRAGGIKRGRTRPFVTRRAVAVAAVILLVGGLLMAPAFGLGGRLLDLIYRPPVGGDAAHDVRDPVWSPDGRRILFTKLIPGNTFLLYVMNADGSGQQILTRGTADAPPAWSPDGRKIAVVRYAYGAAPPQPVTEFLYVIEADRSGQRLLARDVREASPAWSPDGRKIAFVRDRAGILDVYVANADGTGRRRLARGVRTTGDPYLGPLPRPAWSPDGRRITFISNRSGTSEIYVMNADGSGQRRLTRNTASEHGPAWSPDGGKIAFTRRPRDHWSYDDDIYVMRADGTGVRNLTHHADDDYEPHWSLDGRKIFFVSRRDGEDEIYVMNADGSGQWNLTRNTAYDASPTLSPDGRKIAFASTRGGASEIYVMNADGSDQRRLTRQP